MPSSKPAGDDARLRIVMVGSPHSPHLYGRAAAIGSRGHHVHVVTLGDVSPEASVGCSTRPLPAGPLSAVAAVRGFWADILAQRPDLLHLHYAGGRLGTLAALSSARPLVVTVMGGDVLPEQHLSGYSALEGRATRRILEQADAILAKADRLHPAIVDRGGAADRIRTVRWGVDPLRFRPDPDAVRRLRGRLGLRPEARVVLSPRLLRPLYNVATIVEAMPLVTTRVPEALLLITAAREDEAYRKAIEQRVRSLSLGGSVRFLERVSHAEMPALLGLAEVVASVPSSDGLPQTLFEAMACETPVVLGRLDVYREVVEDGEHARLADIAPEPLAHALLELLTDESRRVAMGRAARRRVLEVAALPRELDRVEACYRDALSRPRPPAWRPAARLLDLASLALR